MWRSLSAVNFLSHADHYATLDGRSRKTGPSTNQKPSSLCSLLVMCSVLALHARLMHDETLISGPSVSRSLTGLLCSVSRLHPTVMWSAQRIVVGVVSDDKCGTRPTLYDIKEFQEALRSEVTEKSLEIAAKCQ